MLLITVLRGPMICKLTLGFVGLGIFSVTLSAMAQSESGGKGTVSIVPRISVTETFSSNVSLKTSGAQSELVTEISPGIRISSEVGRLKGYFDYSLNNRFFGQGSSANSSQNALSAFGTWEAIDGRGYIDLSGTISQQVVSALGILSASTSNVNANSTEATSFRVSPFFRGRLSGDLTYEARFGLSTNRTQSAQVSDVTTRDTQLSLKPAASGGRFSWSLDISQQAISYGVGRSTDSSIQTGTLNYLFVPQLSLSASGGREQNNFTSADNQSSFTTGIGLNWSPSENLKLSANRLNRSFGETHSFSVEARSARTSWRFSDSTDVTATPSQNGASQLGVNYDLYFAQFATVEPDPVKRAVLVNAYLQVNGISPVANVVSGFLTSAVSLQRRQDFFMALLGMRDTITFLVSRSSSARLDTLAASADDLSNSNTITQTGLSVNYSHRLTPDASLTVLASSQQSGDALGIQDTTTKTVNVSVSSKLGKKTAATLSARRVVFESKVNPYSESAITGTVNVQF
jgi:uncharacterized protein (PEP-CTERM system associated)